MDLKKVFETKCFLPLVPEELFPFFADAKNLERITPPWLNFRILSTTTPTTTAGTIFNYRLSIKGIPIQWTSIIEEWNPPFQFVDRQLKGPYKLWHHTHYFEKKDGGTLMTDRVIYELPLSWLGQWIAGRYVANDVQTIFDYRKSTISKIFGAPL